MTLKIKSHSKPVYGKELIQDIEENVFNFSEGVRLEVKGKVKFQES